MSIWAGEETSEVPSKVTGCEMVVPKSRPGLLGHADSADAAMCLFAVVIFGVILI